MPYAGVVLHRQNKCIALFVSAGAIDKEHAMILENLSIKKDAIFEKMIAIGLFNECGNGQYFMNCDIAEKLKKNRSSFHLWRLEK